MAQTPAFQVGRYQILSELGRGAMGVVYKARDPQLDRIVAIKTIRVDTGRDAEDHAELTQRLYQEATAVARLGHPHIVAVYDVVQDGGLPHIVMEYVEGRTLADLIAAGPLPLKRAADIVLQLCEALDDAHAHGVVHRDIKTSNILVANDGSAKLGDFGLARVGEAIATQTGAILGTPAYMAPEQVRGRAADARSDLYALGVVMYEAMTGVRPVQGADVAAILYEIVHTIPVPARQRNVGVTPELDVVISRAMAKEPEQRYASARALADAIRAAMRSPARSPARARLRRVRSARVATVIATTACLLIGVATTIGTVASLRQRVSESRPRPATAAPERVPEPTRPEVTERQSSSGAGSFVISTNEAVEVSVDGVVLGRTDAEPFVVRGLAPGEHAVTLRLGSRTRTLRARVIDRTPVALAYSFRPEMRPTVPARTERAPAPDAAPLPAPAAAPVNAFGCLSVNAIPYATVYVDRQHTGETPRACVRVPLGERRVHFQTDDERSSERVVHVTVRHTAEHPLRLSYDFRSRQFLER